MEWEQKMLIKSLNVKGVEYINFPSEGLNGLGLNQNEINQILANEELKNLKAKAIAKRDNLLLESDYLMMPDYPLENKSEVVAYRQALRDITLQAEYPLEIKWPEFNKA